MDRPRVATHAELCPTFEKLSTAKDPSLCTLVGRTPARAERGGLWNTIAKQLPTRDLCRAGRANYWRGRGSDWQAKSAHEGRGLLPDLLATIDRERYLGIRQTINDVIDDLKDSRRGRFYEIPASCSAPLIDPDVCPAP